MLLSRPEYRLLLSTLHMRRRLQAQLDQAEAQQRDATCAICYVAARNASLLPCMHRWGSLSWTGHVHHLPWQRLHILARQSILCLQTIASGGTANDPHCVNPAACSAGSVPGASSSTWRWQLTARPAQTARCAACASAACWRTSEDDL